MPRKALGRGLDALIPSAAATATIEGSVGLQELPIAEIGPNPYQPRTQFDDEAIQELAASIKSSGVLQPILVRRHGDDGYQLVAGERRLRAAGLAGLSRIPAVLKEVDEREMLEIALVENVQRENLSPIEEAKAYQSLVDKAGLTHDQISERVGKQRTSVSNALRLLLLPPEVQDMVSRGTFSAGHARALLALDAAGDQLAAARHVYAKGLSVRRTEAYVRRRSRRQHSRVPAARPNGLLEWETKLQQKFGTHVAISPKSRGGRVEFQYFSQSDLERLLEAWGVL